MIAADTARSKVYLQALARHQLCPGHVLVLRNPDDATMPGQVTRATKKGDSSPNGETQECWSEAQFDLAEPLDLTLERMQASTEVIRCSDINHPDVIEKVREMPQPVLIYSGFGGALLRHDILSAGKRFLHVHGGYLPDYKGSTTSYYSLLLEGNMGASSLFLNAEIDAGPVLQRRRFPPPPDRLAIDHLYDSAARARVLIDTLMSYVATGSWSFELLENTGGETYYVIHPVLKHIAILAEPGVDRCG
jgi:methionyl-tRNA formyltransferase